MVGVLRGQVKRFVFAPMVRGTEWLCAVLQTCVLFLASLIREVGSLGSSLISLMSLFSHLKNGDGSAIQDCQGD